MQEAHVDGQRPGRRRRQQRISAVLIAAFALKLALVALAACYVPARRVLRLEPAQSLRQE